jgi:hypothetical protein
MNPLIRFAASEMKNCESDTPNTPTINISEKHVSQVRTVFGNISQIRDLTKHLLDDLEPTIMSDGKV